MKCVMREDALFDSVDGALRMAYLAESWEICPASRVFIVGGSSGLGLNLDAWEMQAQASYIQRQVSDVLDVTKRLMCEAYFTVPFGQLISKKENAARMLSFLVWEELCSVNPRWSIPRWYLHDVVRSWIGLRREHDDNWWAEHLDKSTRQLRRLRCGDKPRNKPGIETLLDRHYAGMIAALTLTLQEKGVVTG